MIDHRLLVKVPTFQLFRRRFFCLKQESFGIEIAVEHSLQLYNPMSLIWLREDFEVTFTRQHLDLGDDRVHITNPLTSQKQ